MPEDNTKTNHKRDEKMTDEKIMDGKMYTGNVVGLGRTFGDRLREIVPMYLARIRDEFRIKPEEREFIEGLAKRVTFGEPYMGRDVPFMG